jgi:hypothetical protein
MSSLPFKPFDGIPMQHDGGTRLKPREVFGIPIVTDETLPKGTAVMVSRETHGDVTIINIGKPRFSFRRWLGDLLVRAGEAVR